MSLLSEKMTTQELATELKRTPETLIRWRRQRTGPGYLRVQGRILYDRKVVEQWLEAKSVQAGQQ